MVWRRMGLLDDAIRDHLELKRLSGADPGLVAREEKEALTPVFGEELPATDGDIAVAPEDGPIAWDDDVPYAPQDDGSVAAEDVPVAPADDIADVPADDVSIAPEDGIPMARGGLDTGDNRETTPVRARGVEEPATPHPDLSSVGQETAELDMRTVLDEHPGDTPEETSPEGSAIAGPVGGAHSVEEARDGDSLEWEVPERPPHEGSLEAG